MLTIGVCLIIVLVLIYYIIKSRKLAKYYLKLKEDVLNNKLKNNPIFEYENIQNMYKEFEDSLYQTPNVNTQVIIEKYIYSDSKTASIENILEYLVSFATVLGLLGTFIGLTGAISQAAIVLQDVTNMDTFVKELRPAIDSMGGAFITSIFGIIASAIMNLISFTNKNAYKVHKQEFIDEIESYLDNVVAGNRGETQVDKLLISMKQSVDTMTKEVTSTISSSMSQLTVSMYDSMNILVKEITKLNDKITGVSLDMTRSAETLEITVDNFTKPVKLFKNSMDKFVDAYEGMDSKIEDMDDIADRFIKCFNKNMKYQEDIQEVIVKVTKDLDNHTKSLKDSCENLNYIFKDTHNLIKYTDKLLRDNTDNSNESLNKIEATMNNLNKSINEMSEKVANETKEGIECSMKDIINSTKDILNGTMDGLNKNIQLNEGTLQVMTDAIQAIFNQVKEFQEIVHSTR